MLRASALAAILALPCAAVTTAAQAAPAPAPVAPCGYAACAYNIVPVLHGLTVVRGEQEERVATLGFLWTRDISAAFDGDALPAARAAVRTRRWAAVLTDVGLVLLATGAVDAARHDVDRRSATLMMAGAASVGLSVPLQFRADAHLARAVWRYNARFAGAAR